jgi:hypothetical protein
MSPAAAFPIMMGSCAFLMPVGNLRFIRKRCYASGAALGLALGGVPAVLLAAFVVRSLPLGAVRWLVVVVVVYTAVAMLRSAAAALNVCFQLPAGRDCHRQLPGQALQPPAEFSSVEAEGEDHGPVTAARRDIPRLADGSLRLLVPRKAWLSVTVAAPPPQASSSPAAGRARRPLQPLQPQPGHPAGERPDQPESAGSVSLYSPQSASFREPVLRAKLGGAGEAVRIPAGTFIVSVSLPPYAPDLQRLTARPAEHVHLARRPH